MKAFVVLSLMAFVVLSAESAQVRGDRKNSNLAVMLAYRPNSEIQTRDRHSNKTWTYNIENDSSMEEINHELLEALIKERFAKRITPSEVDQRRPVKRENVDEDFESHESHEDIDEAKIVAIGDETPSDKKTCYKNTYKNVLNAFESALKSQIENYKKCVCKKKPTTTTTTEATTTTTTTEKIKVNQSTFARGINSDEDLLDDALANKDDIICFHRKYDFMLSKLLERIPCQAPSKSNDPAMEEFNGEPVKRAERNNNIKKNRNFEADSESVEIDVSEITQKPTKTTTSKPLKQRKSEDSNDKLNEQILAILKEHLKSKKPEKSLKKKQTSPKKITIKPRALPQVEEPEESNEPDELNETSHQQFMKQLQALFEKYQADPDGTFPMQSEERSAESEPSVPSKKSSKKSTIRGTVDESSDESTEAVVKLTTRKAEKKHHKLGDDSGKASKKHHNAINHNYVSNNNPKKSYRSSARVDDASDGSVEESIVSRSHNNDKKSHRAIPANSSTETSISNGSNNSKKANRAGKVSRSSSDDRAATDFAKKISDFARGKPTKSNQ